MQTIILHLRNSRKQRNSYALGESVETESHHQHTQEDSMSKNPYEIRLETLKMAKEMADQQFQLQMDFMNRMIDENQETGKDIKEAYDKYVPNMYKPEEIVKRANELYSYVSEKK